MLETKTAQRVDKYILGTPLGCGSSAEVWKAFDTSLQRYVAVKLLRIEDCQLDPDLIRRFQAGARAIASLNHPSIEQIYDVSPDFFSQEPTEQGAIAYIVTPYIEGETLFDYIARTSRMGKFPRPSEVARLFATIGRALDYAHESGMLHCGMKPANILLDQRNVNWLPLGEPVLADFGLARTLDVAISDALLHEASSSLYIAPELVEGESASRRSDLYSLGVIAYEICTGRLPYEFPEPPDGGHPISCVRQRVSFDPIPPSHFNVGVSPALEAVLLRCIARDPSDRFPDAKVFVGALTSALLAPVENVDLGLRSGSVAAAPFSEFDTRAESSNRVHVKAATRLRQGLDRSSGTWRVPFMLHARLLSPYGLLVSALVSLLLIASIVFFLQGATRMQSLRVAGSPPVLGKVIFSNSGHGSATQNQGVNDEISVSLSHLSPPALGKDYYAWLEGDSDASDIATLLLGQIAVDAQGNAHLMNSNALHAYIDSQHANLLISMSRFLVTEEDARVTPAFPSPDKSTWRYVGAISQIRSSIDQDHFSLLDHLRHLLAFDPTLDRLGLHGGLSLWLYRNSGMVESFAKVAKKDYATGNANDVRIELVSLLDYLDGINQMSRDVPVGTSVLVNKTYAQIGILQLHAYQNPPSYLYHVGLHLNGLVGSPGSTVSQQHLATQIVADLNIAGILFQQVRSIASQLASLSPPLLLQKQGVQEQLSRLVDLATNAYLGKDGLLNGVTWAYEQLENLAVIPVSAYQIT